MPSHYLNQLLSIAPLGTNFSEMSIKILKISFTKIHMKMSSAKWRPFCRGVGGGGWWVKLSYNFGEQREAPGRDGFHHDPGSLGGSCTTPAMRRMSKLQSCQIWRAADSRSAWYTYTLLENRSITSRLTHSRVGRPAGLNRHSPKF